MDCLIVSPKDATPPNVAKETFVNFNRISKVYLCIIFNIELCLGTVEHGLNFKLILKLFCLQFLTACSV